MHITPVTLTGRVVRLEPLSEEHVSGLTRVGLDESIWRFMRYGYIKNEDHMRHWVLSLLEAQERGTDLPFAVIHIASGQAIGATRYLEVRSQDRSLEIGGTWYAVEHQRTAANTESKYLLLTHAFETLQCIRVQFKTDLRNTRSQRAIERLGAVKEGLLRNHMILPDGSFRHSVCYSIIEDEWPAVKTHLQSLLDRYSPTNLN